MIEDEASSLSNTEPPNRFSRLTVRQVSILKFVAQGLTNSQIARELNLSKYTVAQHVADMLRRTGSVNRTNLVNQAYMTGILRNPSHR